MVMQTPPPGPGEVFFRIGPFPVRVTPVFWISMAFLGMFIADNLIAFIAWMAAGLVGVLVHELGHATAMRYFGDHPLILLHAFGGLTYADDYPRWNTTWKRTVVTCFAGPLAGFLLVATLCGISLLIGESVLIENYVIPIPFPFASAFSAAPVIFFLFVAYLQVVCVVWGIMNLMPILPLDGGLISRAIFEHFAPRTGTMRSLQVSLIFAIFLMIWFGQQRSIYCAVLFGMLAFRNFQTIMFLNRRPF